MNTKRIVRLNGLMHDTYASTVHNIGTTVCGIKFIATPSDFGKSDDCDGCTECREV